MSIPIVAIIGLPNSGKSTFFNKVLERRSALTYPVAGTTRDRAYGLANWNGFSFYLVDTAGIIAKPDSELEKSVQKQTAVAKEEADLIIYVADGSTLLSAQDLAVTANLTHARKPIILAVNKIDTRNTKTETIAASYLKLGLGKTYPISSVNGTGIGDLLDAVVDKLKTYHLSPITYNLTGLRIAFIGKPNVGKSSLINQLLKQERLVVHHEAGTTRSTVEVPFEHGGQKFLLLDTAGIKKKWKQDADVAAAAAFQAIRALEHTDVALFTIDASSDLTAQDQIIADQILESKKSCVIVLNKADLIDQKQKDKILDDLPNYLPQMWFLPVIFVSAKTGQDLNVLLKLAQQSFNAASKIADQSELDEFLKKILDENMPGKMEDQRAPKIYSLKQLGTKPPMFRMTVNFPAAIATAWKKWFEKQFRLKFGLEGTPIEIKYIRKQ
ncbi:MAG: ribosome biogenesis GTPase Der [Candidatus Doudnabacteria bacterium RIFCSPLOWO2_01_FULL_44_21]|uniref:GTPase Der n=1 Tax=Candidatus Doudnabacteria bacterium RIFCSPLOWO2_01_FULL_44_21 TaxID=1817841 RepID=A0A1F5Q2J2_9BACT|nr:MAG: ribosome biogenesis GTPase Der [Candidatus Doudnabacteria bacterium RIFCSPHIGHO2_02_FULL_43_13b]OGE96399.1 MAG: ribosome biogenesis GTPase Der [Candidatus Doudnabacteria bacterium RIFCSPLOWO2_01_FULL_44_21]